MTTQFTTDEFFAWLGQWSRLSDWQLKTTLAIAKHVNETQEHDQAAVQESPRPDASRDGYSQEQKDLFSLLSLGWNDRPQDFKSGTVAELARRYGRTEKAIRYQITSRLK